MEKNIGEQLNKAFEAYRHVCMEKERIKKEMTLKIEYYEQLTQSQNQQIAKLKNFIELNIPQPANSGSACHGPPPSPKAENPEGLINANLSNIPHEQLKKDKQVCLLQKMNYKEELKTVQLKCKKLEEEQKKLLYVLFNRNEEIEVLKNILKNANEREKQDYKATAVTEKEVRIKQTAQEPATVGSLPDGHERLDVEKVFCELKGEFRQIYKLTKEQSIRLNRMVKPKENTTDVPLMFSMPVQCTEEPNEQVNGIPNPKDKTGKSSFASITPRGLGPDDEVTVSVESLSNLSVKFPPSGDDCEFLKSSAENDQVLKPAANDHKPPNNFHKEVSRLPVHFACPPGASSDTEQLGATSLQENFKHLDIGNDFESSFLSSEGDNGLCSPLNSPARKYTNNFSKQDVPVETESVTKGRSVRGPQQAFWRPFPHGGHDLLSPDSENWDNKSSEICEFCQAVFPPSSRCSEDFLRHLNSHFFEQS